MRKCAGQMAISDAFIKEREGFLAKVDRLVDWRAIERQLADIYSSSTGRPSYPLLTLFKTLLLQQWYSLSDPAMEEALADRISFRRFTGLSLSDATPDHSTISRFRTRIGDRYLRLFAELNRQFESKNLVVKEGTLMDASFVRSVSSRKEVDPEAGPYGGKPKEREGDDKKKKPRTERVCGYKMHAGVDKGSGIVRRLEVTPANVNDTTVADDLICGDEKEVYGDKAYDKKERRSGLKKAGVFVGIMHRPGPNRPLKEWRVKFNKRMSKIRAAVERVFAVLKLYYRMRRSRYVGLRRTAVGIGLAVMAMNLRRAVVLVGS